MVLHYTGMASAAEALARLCDPGPEVSAHWLIDLDGAATALVPEARRAWHAGAGTWGGQGDVNSRSVGIELQNRGDHPYPEPQMRALERLLGEVLGRWGIPPEGVIGHADMAPGRKHDPGPRFDWRRLARGGLSVWPEAGEAEPSGFAASAAAFGYGADADADQLLEAFRWRFRPGARGPLDRVDAGLALDLARRFPVDRGAGAA